MGWRRGTTHHSFALPDSPDSCKMVAENSLFHDFLAVGLSLEKLSHDLSTLIVSSLGLIRYSLNIAMPR